MRTLTFERIDELKKMIKADQMKYRYVIRLFQKRSISLSQRKFLISKMGRKRNVLRCLKGKDVDATACMQVQLCTP